MGVRGRMNATPLCPRAGYNRLSLKEAQELDGQMGEHASTDIFRAAIETLCLAQFLDCSGDHRIPSDKHMLAGKRPVESSDAAIADIELRRIELQHALPSGGVRRGCEGTLSHQSYCASIS